VLIPRRSALEHQTGALGARRVSDRVWRVQANAQAAYLAAVTPEQAQALAEVNAAGLDDLRTYLASGEAVAFVGAGASAPLYPMWSELIVELVDAAAHRLNPEQARTCQALAGQSPDEIVEIVRRQLGTAEFREVLRETFRVRTDPISGRTWTPLHELVCRCAFKGVVTTNYDPGIVDARGRVRVQATVTGFASYTDDDAMDRWRTGDVFGDGELPVLFAHGRYSQPDRIVLATTEYRQAYTGKLSHVMARLVDAGHLVWIGFSFADQRIATILREVAQASGTRADPGAAPRHVAIMPWDPDTAGNDPSILAHRAEISFGSRVALYPARAGDHSALQTLLTDLVDPRFPPVADLPPPVVVTPAAGVPASWTPAAEPVEHFTGRNEELARLARWAADPTVRLIGVTAWGGAGKTALVTEWIERRAGATARSGVRGVFAWSFYADASAEHWAQALLDWANDQLGVGVVGRGRLGAAVLALLEAVPLVLVLDGLEVVQEGPASGQFGRLLDGTLREVLTGTCRIEHAGLVVLTSRFTFADLEGFDGGTARMLDVPPFTPAEGAALLTASGGGWLPETERRELVANVNGHALAVAVLGGALADRPPTADLAGLRTELRAAAGTNDRVARVLKFYADRLADADRYLVAAVSLFAHPVSPAAVLTVAGHDAFDGHLDGWDAQRVEGAARDRLAGLLSWHPDGTLSAHPLVRDTFRPLALGAAQVVAYLTLTRVPEGTIATRADGLRVVEAIELLLDADQWRMADHLYRSRTDSGAVWRHLPAARLGQRAAWAFVAIPARQRACLEHLTPRRLAFYLNGVGLSAMNCGDLASALEYLHASARYDRAADDALNLSRSLQNQTECLSCLGEIERATRAAAETLIHTASARVEMRNSTASRGWVLMLAGDICGAEECFIKADLIDFADDPDGEHLYAVNGVQWGDLLARTGRRGPCRRLTDRNRRVCVRHGWNDDVARCDRLLGRLDLVAGDPAEATRRVGAAATTFREGDYLIELAETLSVLADCAHSLGNFDAADRHVHEALDIAGPRRLRLSYVAALTVRACIYADRATANRQDDFLVRGRDDADAAYRIATRHGLAWQELDALDAHARLDQVEGIDHGWARRASTLRARLIPPDLDPDPLATVERLVAEDKARSVEQR
jgi:tetratricopeptide (TPR) repeat protein